MNMQPLKLSWVGICLCALALPLAGVQALDFQPYFEEDFQWRLELSPLDFTRDSDYQARQLSQRFATARYKAESKDYSGALADLNGAVESAPKYATAYAVRASLEHHLGYDVDAFADSARAIKLNPNLSYPRRIRGIVESESDRDYTNALLDFRQAIGLDLHDIQVYVECAYVERARTNFAAALGDLDRAIQVNETRPEKTRLGSPYWAAGWIQSDVGQYPLALKNFRKALKQSPSIRCGLRVWVLRARLGDREAATSNLVKHIQFVSPIHRNRPLAVCERFLAGKASEEDLLQAAGDSALNPAIRRRELCTANYYVGMKRMLDGDEAGALRFLQQASATALNCFPDCESATVEAAALEKAGFQAAGP
jgi:tetratricopeptide (TPR) repeat protein